MNRQNLIQKPWEIPIVGILLSLGIIGNAQCLEVVSKQDYPINNRIYSIIIKPLIIAQIQLKNDLPDGIYFYGESPVRDEIGKNYLVIEVKKTQVLGAFYLPSSEFSCTFGKLENKKLALTVIDPYDGSENLVSMLMQKKVETANRSEKIPNLISPQGFYQIQDLTDNERKILDVCKAHQSK
jgi:hypothetical protein